MGEFKGCTRSHPHENMSEECEFKTESARTINHLASSLATTKQKLEASEQAIRESQEQEPAAYYSEWEGSKKLSFSNPSIGCITKPLYAKPITAPQSAEQLHIKELRGALDAICNPRSNHDSFTNSSKHSLQEIYEDIAREALAKQPDTRALDKALLEAEIKVLSNFDECEHKPTWNTIIDMIAERRQKLAELNKE